MTRPLQLLAALLVAVLLLGAALAGTGTGSVTTDVRFFDRSFERVFVDEADMDMADADWTSFAPICTITPAASTAVVDCWVAVDLAKASTGFASGFTSETVQFAVGRKIDGTNLRWDNDRATSAISGTNAGASGKRSASLEVGPVGPTELVVIGAKLSAETGTGVDLPVVIYYRSPEQATIGTQD